ncbi:Farnesyl diphosphate synthase [Astathelohania contejeani]|uniref:Farnesyl diphosphate synthase n=1 Tax=Astathelohania contejeani TaxID=164912 RepID=A0ABQ7HZ91_9MICR|nr:Farnesyl diphosphate synthase [Thelohania contejeani]
MEILKNELKQIIRQKFPLSIQERTLKDILEYIDYNLEGGKLIRLNLFEYAIRHLHTDTQEYKLLGFCIELLHAVLLVVDDVMDNSSTRRGKPCYYLVKGQEVIRTSNLMISLIFMMVEKNYSPEIYSLFSFVIFKTCLGQSQDSLLPSTYTIENYELICEGKNSVYTFYLPVQAALLTTSNKRISTLYEFCRWAGILHQFQDDYLNFFPGVSLKTGNDLEEKKCTWFVCKAAEESSYGMKEFLEGDPTIIRERIKPYLLIFEEEEDKIFKIMASLMTPETEWIYSKCLEMLNKRKSKRETKECNI